VFHPYYTIQFLLKNCMEIHNLLETFRKFVIAYEVKATARENKWKKPVNLSSLSVGFAGVNINIIPEVSLVMNLLQELWSMLEFMMPDIFASEDVDLKKLLSAEDKDLTSRMKSILGPFILRRLKSDVMQQLVRKTQKVCLLPLVSSS